MNFIIHVNPSRKIDYNAIATKLGWSSATTIEAPHNMPWVSKDGENSGTVSPLQIKNPKVVNCKGGAGFKLTYAFANWIGQTLGMTPDELENIGIHKGAQAHLTIKADRLDWSESFDADGNPVPSMDELKNLMTTLHAGLTTTLITPNGAWNLEGMTKEHNPKCFGFPRLNLDNQEHLLFVAGKVSKNNHSYFQIVGTTYTGSYKVSLKSGYESTPTFDINQFVIEG